MSLFGELRRRNVVKVAVAYAIVGWLMVQIADVFLLALRLPEWTVTFVAALLVLGFPIALFLSWAYELTPDGMKRTRSAPLSDSITKVTGRKLDFVIMGLMTVGIVFLVVDNYVLDTAGPFAGADVDPASLEPFADDTPLPPVDAAAEPAPAVAEEERREVLPNSVAVLPFANLSLDPQDAFFAAGIHEETLNQLAKVRNISVISRTSVLRYEDSDLSIPEIAAELNVETVMEGSVRYADGSVRVTAQLIDPETDLNLWSESYNRDLADVFAIQADIAMNIANALQAEFSPADQARIESLPTNSPAAYSVYLKALTTRSEGTGAWISAMDQAIALDPEFALAYAWKAHGHTWDLLGFRGASPDEASESERIIRESANQALTLDPSLGLAHAALAFAHMANWRGAEADQAFERAYELGVDADILMAYGRFKRYRGEYARAIPLLRRAVELDPNNFDSQVQLGIAYLWARNFDAAVDSLERALDLNPTDIGALVQLAFTEIGRDNDEDAIRHLQIVEQFQINTFRLSQLALGHARLGRRDDAQRLFGEFEESANENPVGNAVWARAYVAIGDYQRALERLEAAVDERVPTDLPTLSRFAANPLDDPELDSLEFEELLSGLWE